MECTIVVALSSGGKVSAQAQSRTSDGRLIELVSGKYNYSPPTMDPPMPADGSQIAPRRQRRWMRYVVHGERALGYAVPLYSARAAQ